MKPSILSILGITAILASGCIWAERDFGVECLALVGFTEARSESDICLVETMHVVLVRVTDPNNRWPKTICDAVMEPHQFSGVEKLPYPRRPWLIEPNAPKQWQRALDMADKVIASTAPRDPACLGATHFDQGGGEGKKVLCRCGAHVFSVENNNVEIAGK